MVISYDWGSKAGVEEGGREYMASGWERGVDSILPRDLKLLRYALTSWSTFIRCHVLFLFSLKLSVFIYHQFQKIGQQQQTKNLSNFS